MRDDEVPEQRFVRSRISKASDVGDAERRGSAELLYEGAEFDVGMGNAAEAPMAAAAAGVRPPRPSNWGSMTKAPENKLEEAQRGKVGWSGVMTPWVYPGSRPT